MRDVRPGACHMDCCESASFNGVHKEDEEADLFARLYVPYQDVLPCRHIGQSAIKEGLGRRGSDYAKGL